METSLFISHVNHGLIRENFFFSHVNNSQSIFSSADVFSRPNEYGSRGDEMKETVVSLLGIIGDSSIFSSAGVSSFARYGNLVIVMPY